jgi:hypothetical protein
VSVIPTASPFWLRLAGTWIHLEGVAPGASTAKSRATSEMVTVDGVRLVQQAPTGPRDWTLNYQWATPEALAAIEAAAEAVEDVLFLDTTLSKANMLAPRDCFGLVSTAAAVNAGGVPLRALDLTAAYVRTVAVRTGVTYYVSAWTAASTSIGTVTYPGGSGALTPSAGRVTRAFTPNADGTATVTVNAGATTTSGLMVSEGISPTQFLAGQRMPVTVSVGDPSRTANRAFASALPWSDYDITIKEVG